MKKLARRALSGLLAMVLTLSLLSVGASAEGANATETEDAAETFFTESVTYVNPVYESILTEEDIEDAQSGYALAADNTIDYLTTIEEAGTVMRQQLKERADTITIYYKTSASSDVQQLAKDIASEAMKHTGSSTEGDYLLYQFAGWASEITGFK